MRHKIHRLSKIPRLEYLKELNPELSAVLFDMDGTLLNTEIVHSRSLVIFAEEQELTLIEQDFTGIDDINVYKILCEQYNIHIGLENFLELKNRSYIKAFRSFKQSEIIYSEIKKLIKQIKEQSFKLGLVTSSEKVVTEFTLKELELHKYFDIIITRNDVEFVKPSPFPYKKAMKNLNALPNEVIIFEDSEVGLAAAKATQAMFFKACWYQRRESEFSKLQLSDDHQLS